MVDPGTGDSSITVCKNCWTKIIGPISHSAGDCFTCLKPRHRLTPIQKWWTWFEAFCGPKTQTAEEYLNYLTGEPPVLHSLPVPITTSFQNLDGLETHLQSSEGTASLPFPGPDESFSFQQPHFQTQFAPLQQQSQSPTFEQHRLHVFRSSTAGLIAQAASSQPDYAQIQHMQYDHHGSTFQPSVPDSQQAIFPPTWNSTTIPNKSPPAPVPSTTARDDRYANIEEILVRLQLAEDKARKAEDKATEAEDKATEAEAKTRLIEKDFRELKEICKRQLVVIENLSEGRPVELVEDGINPTVLSAPARSNTRESTDSDLSGINSQGDLKILPMDEFLADIPKFGFDLDASDLPQQDMQGVQYLPDKNTIPHTQQGQPSTAGDSGYGTNPPNKSPQLSDLDWLRSFPHTDNNVDAMQSDGSDQEMFQS
jgi:hypothetical protein